MTDPARTAKRPWAEIRREHRENCKIEPCAAARSILAGVRGIPPCVVCQHEAALRAAMEGR